MSKLVTHINKIKIKIFFFCKMSTDTIIDIDDNGPHLSSQQQSIVDCILSAIETNRQKQDGAEAGDKDEPRSEDDTDEDKNGAKRFFLITGCAGTGKSTLLRNLLKETRARNLKSCTVSAFAMAASFSNGKTIHHTFSVSVAPDYGIPIEDTPGSLNYGYFIGLDVLFVEEFSTCSNYMLSVADERMRRFYKTPNSPFGGRVVVFIGDPLQLSPPISDKSAISFTHRGTHVPLGHCFNSVSWAALVQDGLEAFELEQNYRQGDDSDYAYHLNNIRCAHLEFETCKKLLSRVLLVENIDWPGGVMPTSLYGTLAQVDRANTDRFDKLLPKNAQVVDIVGVSWPSDYSTRDIVKRSNVSASYKLKIGAQVMLRANLSENGLCNGTRGVVSGFEFDAQKKTCCGVYMTLPSEKRILVTRFDFCDKDKHGNTTARFSQIPLCLAWSMTIHKSQGLTISPLLVDIGASCFADSQVYVALSRTTSWNSLFLRNVDFKSIKIDSRIVEIMSLLMPGTATVQLLNRERGPDMPQSWSEMYDFDNLVKPESVIPSVRKMIGSSRLEELCFCPDEQHMEHIDAPLCVFSFPNSVNIIGIVNRTALDHSTPFWTGNNMNVSFERAPFLRTLVYTFDLLDGQNDSLQSHKDDTKTANKRKSQCGNVVRVTFKERPGYNTNKWKGPPANFHIDIPTQTLALVTSGMTQISKLLSINRPCKVSVHVWTDRQT